MGLDIKMQARFINFMGYTQGQIMYNKHYRRQKPLIGFSFGVVFYEKDM